MNEQTRAIMVSVSVPHGIFRVGNRSPWPAIKRDNENTRIMTNGQVIVVGPTTYSLLPKNFSHELCIVVNHPYSSPLVDSNDYLLCESVEEALKLANTNAPGKKVFFLGGKRVLTEALQFCTDAYVAEVSCDCRLQEPIFGVMTLFPEALLLKESRDWMVRGVFDFKEKLGDLGVEFDLRYTHYTKVDPGSIGKD